MGNPKLKWTGEEEEALLAGIEKHGPGKWKNILTDPEFAPVFSKRTNIDLKDKWRNITVSSTGHHGMKDKSKIPKLKSLMASVSANVNGSESVANAMVTQETPLDVVMEDVNITAPETKNAPKYNDLIFKAVASSPNGLDISGIFSYIEKHQEVPANFRRHLSSKLGRLVGHGKLERVKNCYFIKRDTFAMPESKTPSVALQKDTAMEEASASVVYMVADADNKSYLASEAVKEAERVMKMFEDAECFMHLAEEIHDRCVQGQVVLLK